MKHRKINPKVQTPLHQRLSDYLRDHENDQIKNKTLPRVIGDAKLYKTNSIYRGVRNATLKLGYKFTDSPKFKYSAYPLIHLRSIIETKTIPYIGNVNGLRVLEKWRPNHFRLSHLYHMPPETNHLFHESAHSVAHSMMNMNENTKRNQLQAQLVKIMLGESYANATELIGFQQSQDRWLAQLNFYLVRTVKNLSAFEDLIGQRAAFKLTMGLFLYANFLCTSLSPKEDELLFELAEISVADRRARIFKNVYQQIRALALDLSSGFRVNATTLFLKTLSIDTPIEKILDFDPVAFMLKRPDILRQFDALCALVEDTDG